MKRLPKEHLSYDQSEKTEYTYEEQPLPVHRSTPCVSEMISYQECSQPDWCRLTRVPAGHVFYPLQLKQYLGNQAPHELYCFGNLSLLQEGRTVMLCGSRNASEDALDITFRAARQLAEMRVAVTSGYARGVDMAAHQGALSAGGDTIAVLPYGINRFRVARPLREVFDIEHFLVASELRPTHHFTSKGALRRNRLLAAFSAAVIVVEPGDTGGTWYSVQTAHEFGKPFFFIEGRRKDFIDALQRNGGVRIPIRRGTPDLTDILDRIAAQDISDE